MRLLIIFSVGLLCISKGTNANGKPWCKGRNFPGGQECCESEDPEGAKCTEGQGDCDSDEGCAGDLVCGNNNCRDYWSINSADPRDDCCTKPTTGTECLSKCLQGKITSQKCKDSCSGIHNFTCK